ncbi:MAG: hypothetical protein A2887_02230 [Alphaproteobacteria bacterium RIFCSPLOWO2_01_FULL_40_26]|nr:MAG: hypothetical protein A3D15_03000 [Alphaproteobacteria bacterium RIFCSPHIGHO2_02_FULL_40_34]OFW94784.1 MAG: hypothetical protein A2887_02230 [Alphaproteobacteria bacterium RIFCSPLOWO2_01_FULL_40_26]OFX10413.1 MAG: hypothetical protein A3H30_03225 [Alphaproteobacteria bacterium RIFCSPLOWO2_02_FULL_40_19]OFX11294.1 MAG: hypothetical protein A3G22_06115 [Alphaproteobacteria bacterium RIFCSPLOWO2_12_FULL_40_11]
MKKILLTSLIALPLLCQTSLAAEVEKSNDKNSEQSSEFLNFLKKGKPILNIRYLHESDNQKGIANQANANTIRTRIGYETAKLHDFSGLIEFENVKRIGAADYNDTTNNRTKYPTVADPNDVNLNRLYLQYSGMEKTEITVGRQALNLDNQRFIGSIEWRQNNQTMDAAVIKTRFFKNSEIFYAHANRVNRVFGNKSKVGTFNNDNIDLLNGSYSITPSVKITGYSYLLDIPDSATLSSATYGSKVAAKHKFNDHFEGALDFEYAYQRGYADNPEDAVFNYFVVEPSISYDKLTLKGGYNSIGGNGTSAMQFALGTNHAFSGWTDKFLTTPVNGLVESSVALEYVFKTDFNWLNGAKAVVKYYKFRAANRTQNMDYGSETNFGFEKAFKNNLTIGIQAGKYTAKSLYTDTVKIMPYLIYKL